MVLDPFEPDGPNGCKAAVVVWIYGGGYVTGDKTGAGDDATGLLAQSQRDGGEGVIFVAMNYRLGLFVRNSFSELDACR